MHSYGQITIDALQDIEDDLDEMTEEQKGAKRYYLENILQIIDPLRIQDIEGLKALIEILKPVSL